ncbi:hypothetical protein B0T10DRAFT_477249 [Thelonectria olida]|uniref:Secreted protein n=1 Tax=Thelonectria olida TaxID=1576542 RepID=A0A9P9ATF0_9HYPO|nr:hypothetical protein B0T10DRAFT_477249 [Thelonectria olida]
MMMTVNSRFMRLRFDVLIFMRAALWWCPPCPPCPPSLSPSIQQSKTTGPSPRRPLSVGGGHGGRARSLMHCSTQCSAVPFLHCRNNGRQMFRTAPKGP